MPEEAAYAAVFPASDKARYITGATLYIDGGLRLCSQQLLSGD
ncbi:MAG: SDR family oxidoreductase [Aigarchaeota archaeon]|nr:SDR family oxidoreductase [Candidatus Pelearchaeum maunauluense]